MGVLKAYLHQTYPLSQNKIDRIIEEKAENYIDLDKYQSFFLKYQSKNFSEKLKKPTKLSKASDEVKEFFDQEASESRKSVNYSTSSDVEDDATNSRKRKCEFSILDEASSKKKDTSVVRWLPNGDEVRQYSLYYDIYLLYTIFLSFLQFYGKDQDFQKIMNKIK